MARRNVDKLRKLRAALEGFDTFDEAVAHLRATFKKSDYNAYYGGGTTAFHNGWDGANDVFHAMVYWEETKVVITHPDKNEVLNIRFNR